MIILIRSLVFLVHLVQKLVPLVKLLKSKRLIFILTIGHHLFFLHQLVFHTQVVLTALRLWSHHEYIVERNYHRVVIIKLFLDFQLLSQEVSILLDHLIDHLFNHTQVFHDIVLSETLLGLELLEFPASVVVHQSEDFFYACFYGVYLLYSSFILLKISFIFFFVFLNLFLKLLLQLLPFIVFSKSLVFVAFNLFLNRFNL